MFLPYTHKGNGNCEVMLFNFTGVCISQGAHVSKRHVRCISDIHQNTSNIQLALIKYAEFLFVHYTFKAEKMLQIIPQVNTIVKLIAQTSFKSLLSFSCKQTGEYRLY